MFLAIGLHRGLRLLRQFFLLVCQGIAKVVCTEERGQEWYSSLQVAEMPPTGYCLAGCLTRFGLVYQGPSCRPIECVVTLLRWSESSRVLSVQRALGIHEGTYWFRSQILSLMSLHRTVSNVGACTAFSDRVSEVHSGTLCGAC